mgnify:CR=1 FL=1
MCMSINVQPGITIDYATGKAVLSDEDAISGYGKNQWKYREKDVCVE